jgi:hypothetical protein
VKEGKGGGGGDLAGGLAGRRAGERPEIRGGADVRGQAGNERRRKGRGLTHGPGLAATEKEEGRGSWAACESKGRRRGCCPWAGKRRDWARGGKQDSGLKGREREGWEGFVFSKLLF